MPIYKYYTAQGCLAQGFTVKKSYLVCVKLTNFWIFTQPIPIFFQYNSQQKAETTAISNFEISPNLTIPDDMPETLDSITI